MVKNKTFRKTEFLHWGQCLCSEKHPVKNSVALPEKCGTLQQIAQVNHIGIDLRVYMYVCMYVLRTYICMYVCSLG